MKAIKRWWRRFCEYATEPTDRIFGVPPNPVRDLRERVEKLVPQMKERASK